MSRASQIFPTICRTDYSWRLPARWRSGSCCTSAHRARSPRRGTAAWAKRNPAGAGLLHQLNMAQALCRSLDLGILSSDDQQFAHIIRAALYEKQVGADAAQRARTTLLPIPDLVDRKPESRREIVLRHPYRAADCAHVDLCRDMQLSRGGLTARNCQRFGKTFADLVECLFAHRFSPTLATRPSYCSTINAVTFFNSFLSLAERLALSPFEKTVIKKYRQHVPGKERDRAVPAALSLPTTCHAELATSASPDDLVASHGIIGQKGDQL
ncbi:hypothetical protein KL86PLE_60374 [uncultured Pleomorphomonas sp.]|uniref:Uncharacterized protein n=1 Tax=uncultured Pleomorphomonas sp. TaxID=442121 RepID=A0A212LKI8_9HYPH|nr:hypothetical protein KL86PLE_60374 [uncultured Pleomorphomonas sp.]